MADLVKVPDEVLNGHLMYGFSDPHLNYVSGDLWTAVITNSGAVTRPDQAGFGLKLETSDATVADNDETYIKTSAEGFKFAATKPLYSKSVIQFAEAATDDANIFVGFMDAIAADCLQDNGAGPKATSSHAIVYKVDGGTKWYFGTSIGTAQTATLSTTTAGGSAAQTIEIYVVQHTETTLSAWALVNGAILKDSNGLDIMHTLTLGSPTEMNFGYGVKCGSATEQTMNVYFSAAYQKR